MDYLTRRHTHYQELVALGVICGRLTRKFGTETRWTLECTIVGDVSKADAKQYVESYCKSQWEAQNFSYTTKLGAPQNKFSVTFTSWAL